jgi:2,3,4,5-tetrahydropyridine-2-carboxylate N-succinyltransferase
MSGEHEALRAQVESFAGTPSGTALPAEARATVTALLDALEAGTLRAAERGSDGRWRAVEWVKRGILLGFRVGGIVDMSIRTDGLTLPFYDKDTYPPRAVTAAQGVRIVPGGSSVRRGAYLAPGVVCMPPMYVNVGAFVGAGTMVDSHALVGSCAQVGKRCHISAAAQIGGVLEPVGALPVIVEDDVMVGGNCGVYEGAQLGARVVLGTGVILTGSVTVYDIPRKTTYRRTNESPLRIPEGAVVVPGSRRVSDPFAERNGLSLYTPVIVKYRDDKTDAATALEDALR